MTDLTPASLVVTRVINTEGGQPGNSLHSWRCEYPDRYGPCDCVGETADEVVAEIVEDPDALRSIVAHALTVEPKMVLEAARGAGVLELDMRNLRPCGCRAGLTSLMCCDPEAPTTLSFRLVSPWRAQGRPDE